MKRLVTVIAMLGIMAVANVALAYEFTPGQICQVNNTTADHSALIMTYGWVQASAYNGSVHTFCPVTRTYSSVIEAKAYVYNPSGFTTSGYVNFVSTDYSYSNFNQAETTTAGSATITFAAISNPTGVNGFLNFEMTIPANGGIYGFYSN